MRRKDRSGVQRALDRTLAFVITLSRRSVWNGSFTQRPRCTPAARKQSAATPKISTKDPSRIGAAGNAGGQTAFPAELTPFHAYTQKLVYIARVLAG